LADFFRTLALEDEPPGGHFEQFFRGRFNLKKWLISNQDTGALKKLWQFSGEI
jgi:hypothetical protein